MESNTIASWIVEDYLQLVDELTDVRKPYREIRSDAHKLVTGTNNLSNFDPNYLCHYSYKTCTGSFLLYRPGSQT